MGCRSVTDRPFPPVFATNRIERGESVADEINRLLRGLREQLANPPTIAIATAYLNAQGFELLAGELEQAPRVRLMIGAEPQQPEERQFARKPTDSELLAKAIADHEAGLRDERDLAGFTVERDTAERRLVAWLAHDRRRRGTPRVEVRRYTKGFLHGKAYIPESDLAGVLAGSSNLTFAGLKLNLELNLGYETGTHKRLIRDWFEELWAEAEPYDLTALYEERFRLHDPWIVFLRMLVTLYGYPGDEDSAYQPVLRLTGFQRDGVARIRRIIDEWGGVLVADEVGLGKTFLAGELIAEATKRDRQRALVIVPAALKESMWIPFLDAWDLTSARVKVMSYDELRLADDEAQAARRVRPRRHRRGAQPAQPRDRARGDRPPTPLRSLPKAACPHDRDAGQQLAPRPPHARRLLRQERRGVREPGDPESLPVRPRCPSAGPRDALAGAPLHAPR